MNRFLPESHTTTIDHRAQFEEEYAQAFGAIKYYLLSLVDHDPVLGETPTIYLPSSASHDVLKALANDEDLLKLVRSRFGVESITIISRPEVKNGHSQNKSRKSVNMRSGLDFIRNKKVAISIATPALLGLAFYLGNQAQDNLPWQGGNDSATGSSNVYGRESIDKYCYPNNPGPEVVEMYHPDEVSDIKAEHIIVHSAGHDVRIGNGVVADTLAVCGANAQADIGEDAEIEFLYVFGSGADASIDPAAQVSEVGYYSPLAY